MFPPPPALSLCVSLGRSRNKEYSPEGDGQIYWEDTVILLIWGRTGSHAPSMRHSNITSSLSPISLCVCGYAGVWWVMIVLATQRVVGPIRNNVSPGQNNVVHELSLTAAETNSDETEPRQGGMQWLKRRLTGQSAERRVQHACSN